MRRGEIREYDEQAAVALKRSECIFEIDGAKSSCGAVNTHDRAAIGQIVADHGW
jgi:hypothetical protein